MAKIQFLIINFLKKQGIINLLILVTLFVSLDLYMTPNAYAANGIRSTINFQGKLTNSAGNNVADDDYTVVFTLYDDPSAGSNLWDETQTVSTVDGIFQVELGTVDTSLGNVNFNSDTIYLGIKVGADTEMTPRIRFTATPYAFNAQKVNGLTVTNTSGNPFSSATILRIGEGKTVSVNNGLTFAGTDGTTITFQGTDTYVGLATTDILTNKSIGSTGLTFAGATTDITTATDEDLTIAPNGLGKVVFSTDSNTGVYLGSASNTPATLSVSGGIGSNATLIVNQTNSGNIFTASSSGTTRFTIGNTGIITLANGETIDNTTTDNTIIFDTNAANGAGVLRLPVKSTSGDPNLDVNGNIYFNSADGKFRCFQGSWTDCITPSGNFANTDSNTPVALNNATQTSIISASITPSSATNKIWVVAAFEIQGEQNNGIRDITVQLERGASCAAGTPVGSPIVVHVIDNDDIQTGTLNIADTPGVTTSTTYHVCAQSTAGAPNANSMGITLYEPTGKAAVAGSLTVRETDSSPAVTDVASLEFGPASTSTDEFIVSDQTGGVARVRIGNQVGMLNQAETASGVWNFSGGLGVGTTSPLAALGVRGISGTLPVASISGETANAGMIVDNNGLGDLFTASKSGASKFTVLNSGDLQLANYRTGGGFLYTTTTGTVVQTTAGDLGECLKSAGGGTPTWGTCGTGSGGGQFGILNGLLYNSGNLTTDFAIGGASSSSASFLVSPSSTRPTASVSGNTNQAALVVDNRGTGNIFVASASGLNRFVITNSGKVGIGTSGPATLLDVAGVSTSTSNGDYPAIRTYNGSTATNSFASLEATAGNGAVTARLLSSGVAGNQYAMLYTSTATPLILGTNGNERMRIDASGNVGINAVSMLGALDIRGRTDHLPAATVSATTSNAAMFVDNNGVGDLFTASKSGATKFVIKNDGTLGIDSANYADCNALTTDAAGNVECSAVEAGGGADLVSATDYDTSLAATSFSTETEIAQIDITPGTATGDVQLQVQFELVSGSNTDHNATFTLEDNATCTGNVLTTVTYPVTAANGTLEGDMQIFGVDLNPGASAQSYTFCASTSAVSSSVRRHYMNAIVIDTNAATEGPQGPAGGENFWRLSNGAFSFINDTTDFLFGGISSNSAKFKLSPSGTLATASVSGQTAFASFVVDNKGTGDLFTASSSGLNRFVITQNGNIGIGTSLPQTLLDIRGGEGLDSVITLDADEGDDAADTWFIESEAADNDLSFVNNTSELMRLTSAGVLHLGAAGYANCTALTTVSNALTCGSASTVANFWEQRLGLTYLGNLTSDFAIGGLSSASASFLVSPSSTRPTASVSGATNQSAFVVDNRGTGDLFVASSSGLNRFVIKQSGNVGIGTTAPIATLDIKGIGSYATYVASMSGTTGKATLTVDNNGVGDLFTASSSGRTRFVIKQNGDIGIGVGNTIDNYGAAQNITNNLVVAGAVQAGVLGSRGSAVMMPGSGGTDSGYLAFYDPNGNGYGSIGADTTGITLDASGSNFIVNNGSLQVNNLTAAGCDVKADTNGVLSCGTDNTTPGGINPWLFNAGTGVIRPINNTMDLLIGGESTGSAKFSFMNLDSNSGLDPIASFGGTLRLDAKTNSSVAQQTTWTAVSNAAGQLDSGGTSSIASISAMTTYNGSVYAGTFKGAATGEAEVYRYDGTGSNWTRVNTAAGQLATTTSIASISAMTVFDGRLYVGTSKMNQAEIYRYDGGTTWTKVSHPTAGTIKVSGTTNIDGVSSMAVYQGRLYAGTRDGARAELYRYEGGSNWTVVNVTPGTFVPTTSFNINAITSMVVKNGVLYLGVQKSGDADVLRYSGGNTFISMNNIGTTGSYNIGGTAVTAFDEVSAMTVYNGSVVVGLRKTNAAEVLVMNDTPVASGSAVDQWTRLNQSTGLMTVGGTANIDAITSLTVYNGFMYVGTNEPGGAEIYRYTSGDQKFMKVTQAAAGTISGAGGSKTGIDGVVSLLASNGDLYAGTQESGQAEVYRYSADIDRSHQLEFIANPQIAGGTQNSNLNHASIFYLASASANLGSSNGNTGAFIFSHGIQTRNGSYDVAEDYATRDDSLEPGDLVSIDTNERGFVKKSESAYDPNIIGIYSESPALRLSQLDSHIDGARAVPVALAGRVPVKVTTENGQIAAGDYLTASSKPGAAMKATKSGVIIGQAMGEFQCDVLGEICTGKVLAYIKSATYQGNVASVFTGMDTKAATGEDFLAALSTQSVTEPRSEIMTDTLIAGLQIVSPEITTEKLQVSTIEAVQGAQIDIILEENGALAIKDADGETGIVMTEQGDAVFEGTITAEKLVVNEIQIPAEAWAAAFKDGGLEVIESRLDDQDVRITDLENRLATTSAALAKAESATAPAALLHYLPETVEPTKSPLEDQILMLGLKDNGAATVSGRLTVDRLRSTGSVIIEGLLHVVEFITTRSLIVDELATFLGKVVFSGDVLFEGRPTFNSDTAGIAVVKKGTDRVEIRFKEPYENAPMVSANLTLDEISPMPSEELESLTRRQEAIEERTLDSNIRYIVTKRTTKGFVILLDRKATDDVAFSWIAVAVDNPVVSRHDGDNSQSFESQNAEIPRPISSVYPTFIPTSSNEAWREKILPSPRENTTGEEGGEQHDND